MTNLKPVDKAFFSRRSFNWIILGLTYAFFYMGRYNFASGHPAIAEVFGWSYTDYGSIVSGSLIIYGLSVFFNGPLCDKIGGRLTILIGAAGAAIFNLLFGLTYLFVTSPAIINHTTNTVISPAILSHGVAASTVISMMTIIWMLNNYFQSFGALSVVKVNVAWFKVEERGKLAGLFSICIQLGRFLGTFGCSALLFLLPWQYIFWIPSALLALIFLIDKKYLKDSPEDIGYSYFDTPTMSTEKVKVSLVLKKVFANPYMWLFALIALCLGITRNGIEHWYARYFQVVYKVAATEVIKYTPYKVVAISIPVVMILTGFISGWLSDTKFDSRRGPIVVFSFIGQIIFLLCLNHFIFSPWLAAVSIICLLASIQAGHCLIAATASMDFAGRKATATATGFIDGMQYLGGATMGYGMAKVLDSYKILGQPGQEFHMWPLVPLPMAIIGLLLAIPLWKVKPDKKEH